MTAKTANCTERTACHNPCGICSNLSKNRHNHKYQHIHEVNKKPGNCIGKCYKNNCHNYLWYLVLQRHDGSWVNFYSEHYPQAHNYKKYHEQKICEISKCLP